MQNYIGFLPRSCHRFRFRLWQFSRVYPHLRKSMCYLAEYVEKNFPKAHKERMLKLGSSLFPDDRYERSKEVPCQFVVLFGEHAANEEMKGIELLLNHLRIPFHKTDKSHLSTLAETTTRQPAILIAVKFSHLEIQEIVSVLKRKDIKIIAFGLSEPSSSSNERITYIAGNTIDFLPYNSGLRSSLTSDFVLSLLKFDFPVITGFLPPQIGFRIDDVAGVNVENYLTPIIGKGWMPNLGIFIDDFKRYATSYTSYISSLSRAGGVETSPHSFSADEFIFYNYKEAKPFSKSQFGKIWQEVLHCFKEWKFPISAVLNAHFHSFSLNNYETLKEEGVRFIFSELSQDGISIKPGPTYLPSGNPICTTGQIEDHDLIQIYSGDSIECCHIASSLYDFLMQVDRKNLVASASDRIFRKLTLSMQSGFAAFITTHEYLLNSTSREEIAFVLNEADKHLANSPLRPKKVPLSEIGRSCENHTNILIHSIRFVNGKWEVILRGRSNGESVIVVFYNNRLRFVKVPPFQKEQVLGVDLS